MPTFSLTVNGETREIEASEDIPLLYALRNHLNLSGPKSGCEMAQCGACAVMVDGQEVRTCITPATSVSGREITTIEGLASRWAAQKGLTESEAAQTLHPVQQAWIDVQVPQCGFCQSGMMIAATELLEQNPTPSIDDIKQAFSHKPPSPHLCRCGTYAAIIQAVELASNAMKA